MNYKIIISGNKLYKEIILPEDKNKIVIGSAKEAQVRLPDDDLYSGSVIKIVKSADAYSAICMDDNYMLGANGEKECSTQLNPGDQLKIFNEKFDSSILQIDFLYDFGKLQTDYSYQISISDRAVFTIGGMGSDIVLKDDMIGVEHCIITRVNGGYEIDSTDLKYGLFINGVISKANINTIHDRDFLRVYGVDFYLADNKLCTCADRVVSTSQPAEFLKEYNNQFK